MFQTEQKNYRADLDSVIDKLKNKEHFAFSKYADGELHILIDRPINNGEFWFTPQHDQHYRKQMIDSFQFKDDNYFVGISCPCCIGGPPVHQWMKTQSTQKDTHITWANLFVNGNHEYYMENMVPLYSNYDVVLVSNSQSKLEQLPFKVSKHFVVGKNAWVDDNQLVSRIKDYIKTEDIHNHLFLFCAGPFGNLLTHQLFDFRKTNTYIDVGSTLNIFLFGEQGRTRDYLISSKHPDRSKMCVWGPK